MTITRTPMATPMMRTSTATITRRGSTYRILVGYPVPLSLTVQRADRRPLTRLSPGARAAVVAYLAEHAPGATITRAWQTSVYYTLPAGDGRYDDHGPR